MTARDSLIALRDAVAARVERHKRMSDPTEWRNPAIGPPTAMALARDANSRHFEASEILRILDALIGEQNE